MPRIFNWVTSHLVPVTKTVQGCWEEAEIAEWITGKLCWNWKTVWLLKWKENNPTSQPTTQWQQSNQKEVRQEKLHITGYQKNYWCCTIHRNTSRNTKVGLNQYFIWWSNWPADLNSNPAVWLLEALKCIVWMVLEFKKKTKNIDIGKNLGFTLSCTPGFVRTWWPEGSCYTEASESLFWLTLCSSRVNFCSFTFTE